MPTKKADDQPKTNKVQRRKKVLKKNPKTAIKDASLDMVERLKRSPKAPRVMVVGLDDYSRSFIQEYLWRTSHEARLFFTSQVKNEPDQMLKLGSPYANSGIKMVFVNPGSIYGGWADTLVIGSKETLEKYNLESLKNAYAKVFVLEDL